MAHYSNICATFSPLLPLFTQFMGRKTATGFACQPETQQYWSLASWVAVTLKHTIISVCVYHENEMPERTVVHGDRCNTFELLAAFSGLSTSRKAPESTAPATGVWPGASASVVKGRQRTQIVTSPARHNLRRLACAQKTERRQRTYRCRNLSRSHDILKATDTVHVRLGSTFRTFREDEGQVC
jgi:hypothetical protein